MLGAERGLVGLLGAPGPAPGQVPNALGTCHRLGKTEEKDEHTESVGQGANGPG